MVMNPTVAMDTDTMVTIGLLQIRFHF